MIPRKLKTIRSGATINVVILALVTFILASFTTAYGATYYVSAVGNNLNPGTEAQPWRTIQHAADMMVAGDTVYIKGGTYNENVQTMHSGNISAGYIIFSAYPGENPVIDGIGVSAGDGFILNKDYIKLSGLEVRNWNGNAIWIQNAAHFEISDCVVHEVTYGIGISDGSHDFELNRVVAHHYDLYGFDVSPSGGADCYNGTFNDCIAHTGRDPLQNVDGFALGHGNQHDFVFNRCETYNVYDGFDISARQTTLNRCSAHNCWNGGYKIWQDDVHVLNSLGYNNESSNVELDWDGQPGVVTLQNCTFMDSGSWNIWVENASDSLHMHNCILAGGDNNGLAFEQMGVNNYQGDFNIFHNDNQSRAINVGYQDEFSLSDVEAGDWTAYSGQDANSIVVYSAGVLFADPVNFDLHLTETCIARDNGTSAGAPPEDYDGNPRPQGTAYDIGAYEYGLPSAPIPDIKVNNSDGPLIIAPAENLSVTVSLNPGSHAEENADWWGMILYAIPGNPLQYLSHFTIQVPLFNLPSIELFNFTGLPNNVIIVFVWGVDITPNGIIDQPLYFDAAVVGVIN